MVHTWLYLWVRVICILTDLLTCVLHFSYIHNCSWVTNHFNLVQTCITKRICRFLRYVMHLADNSHSDTDLHFQQGPVLRAARMRRAVCSFILRFEHFFFFLSCESVSVSVCPLRVSVLQLLESSCSDLLRTLDPTSAAQGPRGGETYSSSTRE